MNTLPIIINDPWLRPVADKITKRYNHYLSVREDIIREHGSLLNYADSHQYFGFHYDNIRKGHFFRDWLPRAEQVFLVGDFNGWEPCRNPLEKLDNGVWEIFLPDDDWKDKLTHKSRVKLYIKGNNGWTEHIPAYIQFTIQNEQDKSFSGVFWNPPTLFDWQNDNYRIPSNESLLIYECHIGMAQEKQGVGTYPEFIENVLPYIKDLGYNALQVMALAEHPYYGSFGYQVSNFFAPSSRFGSPEELKLLIKTAHQNNIAIIMDIVHSHFVSNSNEGLNMLDGEDGLYSPWGEKGNHPHWKSKLFDYSKPEVRRFLLSNVRYWMEEFHIDGFRFDGVTSMIYKHHGYVDDFGTYENYFGEDVDIDALTYLTLANELVHEINPQSGTIAEEVSGMPGMALPIADGGIGFDYRMAMAIPDYWIKILKTQKDEDWNLSEMWNIMTERLWNVKTVTYCESHDQALVGDKTIAFRLMDKAMYSQMEKGSQSMVVDRGIALHKMIRLFTITLGGQAYLNFMGNEFGHPEWIDFPRQDNEWSYQHARRQWSLLKNENLRYSFLYEFDKFMLQLVKDFHLLSSGFAYQLLVDDKNKTIVYESGELVFVFNWHVKNSISDYVIPVRKAGKYGIILNTDHADFGGFSRIKDNAEFFTFQDKNSNSFMKIYNINRAALVFQRKD